MTVSELPIRRMSVGSRVALLAAVCVAGAVALVSLGAYLTVSNGLYDQIDQGLRDRAKSAQLAPDVTSGIETMPGAFLAAADVQIGLLDAVSGKMKIPVRGTPPPVGQRELSVARGEAQESLRTDDATGSRVIAVPFANNTALVIAQPLKPTQDTLGKLAAVLFTIGGAGVLIAALAGTAVARGGLRPVQRLTEAAEYIAHTGDLRPIPVSGGDELARLTQSFNSMLAAVDSSQERQRRLVADAGHELRTPLTSLRTNLELLMAAEQPNAPTLSDEDKKGIREDLHGQLDEITQLVGDLVELARDDGAQPAAEQVDFTEVVEMALDRARRRAGTVRFDVTLRHWYLNGDPGALQRAVLNLLDNAVKFSPQNATVRVQLTPTEDGYAFLQVADAGPGISDGDLPHVFDRFYRSQEARMLPGSGLGLAIVKQAVERHGGTVYAGRSADGGALMAIRLPGWSAPPDEG